jgi:hypothetical protein
MNMILKDRLSGRIIIALGALILFFSLFIQVWPLLAADNKNSGNFSLRGQNRSKIDVESSAVKGKQITDVALFGDDFHLCWIGQMNPTAIYDTSQLDKSPAEAFSSQSQEKKTRLSKAGRFNRFHLSGSLEYIQSPTGGDLTNIMRQGIFEYPQEVASLMSGIPAPMAASVISFSERSNIHLITKVGFEFSLSRKFAVGLLYSYLGTHTITGDWQGVTLVPDTGHVRYFIQQYCASISGKSEASAYFLTASFFLIPALELSIPSFEFMVGVGLNHTKLDYAGYSLGFTYLAQLFYPNRPQLDGNEKTITQNSPCYLFSMNIIIFGRNLLINHLSLSVESSYIIAPVKNPPIQIIYDHC